MNSRQFTQYILGLVFLVSSSFVLSNTQFTYNVIDGGIEVTSCVEVCPSDLVIPEEIDGYNVISIGESAFSNQGLNSVELPNTLTSIKAFAFIYNNFASVEIPSSVAFIGGHAFDNNQLATIQIPTGISIIHESAFRRNQIQELIIPSNIIDIRANAFRGNNISNLIIPNSVNSIADGAFASNKLLHISFLGAPTVIYGSPFDYNTSLTSVMYCENPNGEWDDVIIEGITPQLDESCNSSDEVNESVTYTTFDIDQSGSVDALSDGLILLRYFFGLRGDALINNVISPDANRTSAADIEAYIESHMP